MRLSGSSPHSADNVFDECLFNFSRISEGVFYVPSPNSLEKRILAGCFSKIFSNFFHGSIEVLYNGIFVESVSSADFSER